MLILSPYTKPTMDGSPNAKQFPWWQEVVDALCKDIEIVQIGANDEKRLDNVKVFVKPRLNELAGILKEAKCFASVDNFLQHFVYMKKLPIRGVVVWSQSNPSIFGYPNNVNLLKDRKYLRQYQWHFWHQTKFDENAFVQPDIVVNAIRGLHG